MGENLPQAGYLKNDKNKRFEIGEVGVSFGIRCAAYILTTVLRSKPLTFLVSFERFLAKFTDIVMIQICEVGSFIPSLLVVSVVCAAIRILATS